MASRATGPADALAAVVLAGGRSTRLGGQDKAALLLDGARLVDRVVAAAQAAGAREVVVVGPASLVPGVPVVQEEPPFGGPVAGVAAGLAALGGGSTAVLVLACDLADPSAAVGALTAAWDGGAEEAGVHLLDEDGRPQWLTGIYRLDSLESALTALGDPAGQSARRLLSALPVRGVEGPASAAADIDTWEDWEIVRRRHDSRRAR
ncbi:molybdenum cofactor guanylyltransferase [Pseudactinotalea terrae]|uniref:molybdenum cofactor guanylyltransferase n=1 Tax=Pseudactinotalea terrae TaxID=1743262 RepID=UPI001F4FA4B2|nr:NTP transferase domain-containing protein [Pseudactinotalea terrae]